MGFLAMGFITIGFITIGFITIGFMTIGFMTIGFTDLDIIEFIIVGEFIFLGVIRWFIGIPIEGLCILNCALAVPAPVRAAKQTRT